MKACGIWKPAQPGAEDGLDAPLLRVVDSEEARIQVELLYGKIVDDVRTKRDKKDKELFARAEVEKRRFEEAAKRRREGFEVRRGVVSRETAEPQRLARGPP